MSRQQHHMPPNETADRGEPTQPGRRRLLKFGVAAGVGTAVWSEPTIKGILRRPAYADALSSPIAFSWPGAGAPEPLAALSVTPSDVTIVLDENFDGLTLSAVYMAGTPDECTCTFDAIGAGELTLHADNGETTTNVAGGAGASVLQFGTYDGGGAIPPTAESLSGAGFSGTCG